jgi:uncharacterized cupredoxin-like copper-binding protein
MLPRAAAQISLAASLLLTATLADAHAESLWFGHPGEATEVTRTIKMVASDIKFTPTAVTVRKGETIMFEIVNQGKLEHEFVLGDSAEQVEHDKEMAATPGMKMDHVNGVGVAPGQTARLVWTFTKSGTVQYACHVPGHFVAGMVGQLKIQ